MPGRAGADLSAPDLLGTGRVVGEGVLALAEAHDSGSKNMAVRQHHSRIRNLEFIAMSSPIKVFGVMICGVQQASV
jgi:hypothetical protein